MIHIVTDTAADLTKSEMEIYNIEVLPVLITINDETKREFYDISPIEYYDILQNAKEVPKTAQITLESLLSCFENAEKAGVTELLYITINASGSGTYSTACIARDMYYEENGNAMRIEIIDSKAYSYVYGMTVVGCAKMKNDGQSFDEIITWATENIENMRAVLGVYDLKQLKKSGRISGGAAFVGDAMGIKPILKVGEGEVEVFSKVRGEANLPKKILELTLENAPNTNQTVCIVKGVCDDEVCNDLQKELEKTYEKVIVRNLGASIVTNCGAKSLGVVYHI